MSGCCPCAVFRVGEVRRGLTLYGVPVSETSFHYCGCPGIPSPHILVVEGEKETQ